MEIRERVGDTRRAKSQRTPRDTIEGLLLVDKITCPFCQQDHFADRHNIITNVNTSKRYYNVSRDVLSVQIQGITQEIVKAREHFRCLG